LEQLPLSRDLVTIKTDVALEQEIDDLSFAPPDIDALRELYTRYEFTQALKDLADPAGAAPAPDNADGDYQLVTDAASLQDWLQRLQQAELIAMDTETTALDAMRADLVGMSFAVTA